MYNAIGFRELNQAKSQLYDLLKELEAAQTAEWERQKIQMRGFLTQAKTAAQKGQPSPFNDPDFGDGFFAALNQFLGMGSKMDEFSKFKSETLDELLKNWAILDRLASSLVGDERTASADQEQYERLQKLIGQAERQKARWQAYLAQGGEPEIAEAEKSLILAAFKIDQDGVRHKVEKMVF
jgi:hypothetical protein